MRCLLHILTPKADELALEIIRLERELPNQQTEVIDLTKSEPNYDALVQHIFEADSVQVW